MHITHQNITYKIPTSYNELTYKEFIKVKDWDGIHHAELIEKLLDIDYDIALYIADNHVKYKDVEFLDSFDQKKLTKKPKKITLKGKTYRIPNDLFNESTFGQIVTFREIIKSIEDYDNEVYQYIPKIVSIYLYKVIHGNFDSRKYESIIKDIEECNFIDVTSIGFFLLRKLIALGELNNKSSRVEIQKDYQS